MGWLGAGGNGGNRSTGIFVGGGDVGEGSAGRGGEEEEGLSA